MATRRSKLATTSDNNNNGTTTYRRLQREEEEVLAPPAEEEEEESSVQVGVKNSVLFDDSSRRLFSVAMPLSLTGMWGYSMAGKDISGV